MRLPSDRGAGVLATAMKLGDITQVYEASLQNSTIQENRMVDIDILSAVFSSLACCECLSTTLKPEERKRARRCENVFQSREHACSSAPLRLRQVIVSAFYSGRRSGVEVDD
ncbi:hypothetical protein HPB52_006840 [Rhipicephalus sanguineus]|uniref:Uncharacterized protein n=1 Tax=Rhipicephalus sanguineus TaxID=34632 RepID=A0A9D4SWM2_RHISA|nr:hypothetical protein HPB52_006840 [Rhipicephalus sanguineus]